MSHYPAGRSKTTLSRYESQPRVQKGTRHDAILDDSIALSQKHLSGSGAVNQTIGRYTNVRQRGSVQPSQDIANTMMASQQKSPSGSVNDVRRQSIGNSSSISMSYKEFADKVPGVPAKHFQQQTIMSNNSSTKQTANSYNNSMRALQQPQEMSLKAASPTQQQYAQQQHTNNAYQSTANAYQSINDPIDVTLQKVTNVRMSNTIPVKRQQALSVSKSTLAQSQVKIQQQKAPPIGDDLLWQHAMDTSLSKLNALQRMLFPAEQLLKQQQQQQQPQRQSTTSIPDQHPIELTRPSVQQMRANSQSTLLGQQANLRQSAEKVMMQKAGGGNVPAQMQSLLNSQQQSPTGFVPVKALEQRSKQISNMSSPVKVMTLRNADSITRNIMHSPVQQRSGDLPYGSMTEVKQQLNTRERRDSHSSFSSAQLTGHSQAQSTASLPQLNNMAQAASNNVQSTVSLIQQNASRASSNMGTNRIRKPTQLNSISQPRLSQVSMPDEVDRVAKMLEMQQAKNEELLMKQAMIEQKLAAKSNAAVEMTRKRQIEAKQKLDLAQRRAKENEAKAVSDKIQNQIHREQTQIEKESYWLVKQQTLANDRQQKSMSKAQRIQQTLANAKRIEQEKEQTRIAAVQQKANRERNRFHKNMQIGDYQSQLSQQKNEIYISKVQNAKIEKEYETLQKAQQMSRKDTISQYVKQTTSHERASSMEQAALRKAVNIERAQEISRQRSQEKIEALQNRIGVKNFKVDVLKEIDEIRVQNLAAQQKDQIVRKSNNRMQKMTSLL